MLILASITKTIAEKSYAIQDCHSIKFTYACKGLQRAEVS